MAASRITKRLSASNYISFNSFDGRYLFYPVVLPLPTICLCKWKQREHCSSLPRRKETRLQGLLPGDSVDFNLAGGRKGLCSSSCGKHCC